MKNKFNSESLRPFIDMDGLKGDEIVERKRFSSRITISPDEERTVVALITNVEEDADNDIIISTGADLKRFTKNPVIHINHSYKVEDVVGKAIALSVQEDGILAKIQFASTPKAEDTWNLVKNGYVSANSIGFLIKEAFYAGTEEFKSYIKENKIKVKDTVRRIISKFELLESSIVSIPCNPEALMQAISSKSIQLSEDTIKELDLPKVVVIRGDAVLIPDAEPVVLPVVAEPVIEVKVIPEVIVPVAEPIAPVIVPPEAPKGYIKVLRHGSVDINKIVELRKLAKRGKVV